MQSLETLRYRLRYSPLPRLVLNGLKRLGVTILPYYLFTRPVTAAPHAPVDRGSACLIELHEQDMATIAALPMATNRESAFRARLRQGQRCFGLRLNGEIVSYCWMATGSCRVNGEDIVMAGDEVYAFDIYTLPAQRGGNLAPLLNALFTEMLRAAGGYPNTPGPSISNGAGRYCLLTTRGGIPTSCRTAGGASARS